MLFWNNLRYAARQLWKRPILTGTILATLALCIGVNAAIFTVVDALLFRPLPYPQPGRLVLFTTTQSNQKGSDVDTSQDGTQWELIRDHATLVDAAAYGSTNGVNLVANGSVEFVHSQRVGAGFFRVLGTGLDLGREFTRDEDVPNGPALAIISYNLWQRVFHGDRKLIDRTIDLRGMPYTVVGIAPPAFRSLPGYVGSEAPPEPDVWTPLHPTRSGEGAGDNYGIVGRLKPGVSLSQLDAQLAAVMRDYFMSLHLRPGVTEQEHALPLQTGITFDLRSGVRLMWGAVLLVLLIGCINVAGILVSQSAGRAREVATRLALGASRGRVVSELFTESLLLAAIGGLLGISLGAFAVEALVYINPAEFMLNGPIQLNGAVVAIALAASLLTSLLFGLFPAFEASAVDLRSALAEAGRSTAGSRRQWKRQLLVFAEVALGVVLVIWAGLLIRTFVVFAYANPGFDSTHLVIASASLQDARYASTAAGSRLFKKSLEEIEQIPGVQSAAVALASPFGRPLNEGVTEINGDPAKGGSTELTYATSGLFSTLRMRILAGRVFQESDTEQKPRVAVVNQAFAERYFHNSAAAIGSIIKVENRNWQVVGVVNSIQEKNGLGLPTELLARFPEVYVPAAQFPDSTFQMAHVWLSPVWIIRSNRADLGFRQALQQALFAADPRLPFSSFKTISQIRSAALQPQFYRATIFSVLAGLAVLLAAIGLYGLIAQSVEQRKREMGIRLALGARIRDIVVSAVAPGLALSLAGIACGGALALFVTRLLKSLIWGVGPNDPPTFVVVAFLLLVVASLASFIPALRLTKIDPARTLRDE